MSKNVQYNFTPNSLRTIVKGLEKGTTNQYFVLLFQILYSNTENPQYFLEQPELTQVLFSETFPELYQLAIEKKVLIGIKELTNLYIIFCARASSIHLFLFEDQMAKILSLLTKIYQENALPLRYFCYYISNTDIIHRLIDNIVSYQTFTECSSTFDILNYLFPHFSSSLLNEYFKCFSKYKFSLEDKRFQDPISISFTKALCACSVSYSQFHYDNLIKFIKESNLTAAKELLISMRNQEFLKSVTESLLKHFELIKNCMIHEIHMLEEFVGILLSNQIIDEAYLNEAAGNDLLLNTAYFNHIKRFYSKEKIDCILNSEPFSNKTVEFGFKLIQYNYNLISNLAQFLKNCFSQKEKNQKDYFEIITTLSNDKSNNEILLKSIEDFQINNQIDFNIISLVIHLLRPTKDQFDFTQFVDESLNYINSVFIYPFIEANDFLPIELFDAEFLLAFTSPFTEKFARFLLDHFLDDILMQVDFLLDYKIDDTNENAIYGNFLLELYKKMENKDNRLVWDAIIRVRDTNEEIHSCAQQIINENPKQSQEEIINEINKIDINSKYFLNFDYSKFPETPIIEDGIFLIFNRPAFDEEQSSFFCHAANIRYQMNHDEEIDKDELDDLSQFIIGNDVIDSIISYTYFEATQKLNIEYENFDVAIELAFAANHKEFIHKLFGFIFKSDVVITSEILNCFSLFNIDYALELIEKGKVSEEELNTFLLNQTEQSHLILQKISNRLSPKLLDEIIFSKDDFIAFIQANRISDDSLFDCLFSPKFPQKYRTTKMMKFIFDRIQSKPQHFINFLKTIQKQRIATTGNCIPKLDQTNYPNVFRCLAEIVPHFNHYSNDKLGSLFSQLIYSRASNLVLNAQIKNAFISNSINSSYQMVDTLYRIFEELPYDITEQMELEFIKAKTTTFTSDIDWMRGYSIQAHSISEELTDYTFFNQPKFIMISVEQPDTFVLEKEVSINKKRYVVKAILTQYDLYLPHKDSHYTKWSNNIKSHVSEISDPILFLFYQLYEGEYDELLTQMKKFRSSNYKFNQCSVIYDALNKASIDWSKWTIDESLFELSILLLSKCGYDGLFETLLDNTQFALYFFVSKERPDVLNEKMKSQLKRLVEHYPNKQDLIHTLIETISENPSQRTYLTALSPILEFTDNDVELLISKVTPSFNGFASILLKYFMNSNRTNQLLRNDQNLARFVFKLISAKSSSYDKIRHLLTPMTNELFRDFISTRNFNLIIEFIRSQQDPFYYLIISLSYLPHDDQLAQLFEQINMNKEQYYIEIKKNLSWVEPGLSSSNESIRNKAIEWIAAYFDKSEGVLLASRLKRVLLNTLTQPYFISIRNFIVSFFGSEFLSNDPRFTEQVYTSLFNLTAITEVKDISLFLASLSPVSQAVNLKLISQLQSCADDNLFFYIGYHLIFLLIHSNFQPDQNSYGIASFMKELLISKGDNLISRIFEYLTTSSNNQNIAQRFVLILEFEQMVPYYLDLINNFLINLSEFRETELVLLALLLPTQIRIGAEHINTYFPHLNQHQEIMKRALEIANQALLMILDKKAFIRNLKDYYISDKVRLLMNNHYFGYINKYAFNILNIYTINIEVLKNFIQYFKMNALVFKDILHSIFQALCTYDGYRLFGDETFILVEKEWSEFCCEICRQILADIQYNTPEYRRYAMIIIDRELSCELFKYNRAEQAYLKFIIGAMNNDEFRNQTRLQFNFQIMNVFKNDNIEYIDDVCKFISVSLDKYPDEFYKKENVLEMASNIKFNDSQLKEKLDILTMFIDKRKDKIKDMFDELLAIMAELCETSEDGSNEQINRVLESILVISD